jgi:hypothetical protein
MKLARWYKIESDVLYVFDSPIEEQASGVSICYNVISDLKYYRKTFTLRKLWAQ